MLTKDIPTPELAPAILEELSECVMRIGPLLDQAFEEVPDFCQWVEDELPLRPRTAERVRAMWMIWHNHHNGDVLPEPYKALWSLD